jgi:WD40 repeat protein/predicted Ser/Thr protein kinase
MTDPDDPNQADEAVAWYYSRAEAGSPPTRAELLARFPHLAADLDAFLADKAAFDRAAGPGRAPDETVTLPHAPDPDATVGGTVTAGPLGTVRYVGDYELLAEIARGGMGVVYRARQVSLNRPVAVKMILAGELASAAEVKRFRAEAEAAAALDHPNILPIYEIGEHEGRPYFSMKLVDGPGFGAVLRSTTPGGDRRAIELLAAVCRAVHFAHQRGVLHRDLKPSNVLIDKDGTPYVTDFGLAKRTDTADDLTRTGAVLGTPGYIAPEQARGEKNVSTAADVYSLGAVLYEVLTGRPPFAAGGVLETLVQVRDREPDHPRAVNPAADPDLSVVALKCLEKEPGKRYESAATLADELGRWLRGEPITARPAGTAERAAKWVRRNPAVAALSAAVLATLVAGSVTSTVFGLRSADEAREAREARKLADDRADDLAEAVERVTREEAKATRALAREVRAGYVARVGRAYADWQANDAARARRALADCPPEFRGWEWHYLDRAFHAEKHAWGTSGPVRAVVVSPDGKYVYAASAWQGSAGGARHIDRWDLATGNPDPLKLEGDSEEVVALALFPDGKKLAAAVWCLDDPRDFGPGAVDVYDLATGKRLHRLVGHEHPLSAVAVSPDGSMVASAGWDKKVIMWDAATGKRKLTFTGHKSAVRSVVFSPQARPVVSVGYPPDAVSMGRTAGVVGGGEPVLLSWDPETGEEVARHPTAGCAAVAIGRDPEYLAAASDDGATQVRALTEGGGVARLHGHRGPVLAVAWHPTESVVATAGADTAVRLCEALTGRELRVYRGHALPVRSLAFTPDGSRLVAGGGEWGFGGEVKVWDVTASPDAKPVSGPGADRFAATPDGTRLVVGFKDKLAVIDPATGAAARVKVPPPLWAETRMRAWVDAAANRVTVDDDRGYTRYDLETGAKLPNGIGGDEFFGAVSDDGTRILVKSGETGGIDVREVATGKTLCRVSPPGLGTYPLAISPDGKWFAAPFMGEGKEPDDRPPPRAVGVFDADTGAKVCEIPLARDDAHNPHLTLGPGGRTLVVGLRTRAEVWAVPSGERRASFPIPETGLPTVRFAPDGSWFLVHAGYHDRSECIVRDVAANQERYRLRTGTYDTFAISPDGRRLARGTPAGVFVHDASTGDEVLSLRDATGPVAWGGGGTWLFARGPDGAVRLHDGTPRE